MFMQVQCCNLAMSCAVHMVFLPLFVDMFCGKILVTKFKTNWEFEKKITFCFLLVWECRPIGTIFSDKLDSGSKEKNLVYTKLLYAMSLYESFIACLKIFIKEQFFEFNVSVRNHHSQNRFSCIG